MAGGVVSRGSGRSQRGRRKKTQPMAEINVTPMVDVMLVLEILTKRNVIQDLPLMMKVQILQVRVNSV